MGIRADSAVGCAGAGAGRGRRLGRPHCGVCQWQRHVLASIEGENPLYLPQAKIYTGSCALGPCLATPDEVPDLASLLISMRVVRGGAEVVVDTVKVADLHRRPGDLVAWLFRAQEFPVGVVLLTGTAIVPPPGFTLHAGDEVIIATTGLGELRNVVETV